jgi:hypothetical protein
MEELEDEFVQQYEYMARKVVTYPSEQLYDDDIDHHLSVKTIISTLEERFRFKYEESLKRENADCPKEPISALEKRVEKQTFAEISQSKEFNWVTNIKRRRNGGMRCQELCLNTTSQDSFS